MRVFLLLMCLLTVLACKRREGPEMARETCERLEEWAGRLAPVVGLPPGMAPEAPDSAAISDLIRLCEETPGGYSYFYMRLADSVNALEPPSATCEDGFETLQAPGPIPIESLIVSPGGTPGTGPSTR